MLVGLRQGGPFWCPQNRMDHSPGSDLAVLPAHFHVQVSASLLGPGLEPPAPPVPSRSNSQPLLLFPSGSFSSLTSSIFPLDSLGYSCSHFLRPRFFEIVSLPLSVKSRRVQLRPTREASRRLWVRAEVPQGHKVEVRPGIPGGRAAEMLLPPLASSRGSRASAMPGRDRRGHSPQPHPACQRHRKGAGPFPNARISSSDG